MEIEMIQSLIQNLGFPIFIAIWLLVKNGKFTKIIQDNTLALKELSVIIKNKK